jgi:cytochrome c-type biogenesis protein
MARDAARYSVYVWPMFGIEIIDAALLPAIFVALLAGVISFLSPCVLPIVPPYIAYMSGISLNELSQDGAQRARALVPALFFVLGLSTVFIFLGFTASALGRAFLQYQDWFNTVAGVLVMAFGAHFVGVYRIGFLDREARLDAGDRGGSAFGAYILLPRLTGLMGWMKRHMERIERVMGLLLWTIGLLMLTGGFSAFSFWLLETFPALALIG